MQGDRGRKVEGRGPSTFLLGASRMASGGGGCVATHPTARSIASVRLHARIKPYIFVVRGYLKPPARRKQKIRDRIGTPFIQVVYMQRNEEACFAAPFSGPDVPARRITCRAHPNSVDWKNSVTYVAGNSHLRPVRAHHDRSPESIAGTLLQLAHGNLHLAPPKSDFIRIENADDIPLLFPEQRQRCVATHPTARRPAADANALPIDVTLPRPARSRTARRSRWG